MNDRARHTPPPTSSTQPPWMLTPPRSAEKLMRALSIDPCSSTDKHLILQSHDDPDYFTYLQQITSPTYRDPPLPPASHRQEPLFLDDDGDDDDVLIGTDNRMVLFQSHDTPTPAGTIIKRPYEEDDDIEFTGAILPPDGIAYLGQPMKRRRKVKQERPVEDEDEEDEQSQLAEVDEEIALQEVEPLQRGCQACRCFCNTVGTAPKRSGSGSTTLSPRVLGDLLHMLMGEGRSLLSTASRMNPGIQTWADIAERVGARREDFDRVRHAASGMQQTLPQKKARGEF